MKNRGIMARSPVSALARPQQLTPGIYITSQGFNVVRVPGWVVATDLP